MIRPNCPYCSKVKELSVFRTKVVLAGKYYRTSDRKHVRKFRCLRCLRYFSRASRHACLNQNKRHLNETIRKLLCSGVSQRRIAKLLKISRTTVTRKLIFLGAQAQVKLKEINLQWPKAEIMEFDDLETFEHTKFKPLSILLAVEHRSRRILGFEVSQMPAKGKLARLSRKKYGPRPDRRAQGREWLFRRIKPFVHEEALIKSDENPHYPVSVRRHFSKSIHEVHKGQRGSIVGQGELKKVRFDPLFSLNHTCAMLRANVNRLFRKTWCTTKKPERLTAHLAIYALFHNLSLI